MLPKVRGCLTKQHRQMSLIDVRGPCPGTRPWPLSPEMAKPLFFTFVVQDHVILEVHFRGHGALLVTVHQQDGALATWAPGPGALGISEGQMTLSVTQIPSALGRQVLFFFFLSLSHFTCFSHPATHGSKEWISDGSRYKQIWM